MVARKMVKVTSELRANYERITSELLANNRRLAEILRDCEVKNTDYLCKITC